MFPAYCAPLGDLFLCAACCKSVMCRNEVRMEKLDICYLCTIIGNLSGIPVRIFKENSRIFYSSVVHLPKDPMVVYEKEIWKVDAHIGYFATAHFHYYGIVNSGTMKIVIGPTRQIPDTEQELRELAFRADVAVWDIDDFVTGMKSIVRMPLESMMQMLCTINYILNGEKKSLEDISIYEAEQKEWGELIQKQQAASGFSGEASKAEIQGIHNTFDLEQMLMDMIQRGDFAALKEWVSGAPAIRSGVLAADQLRQRKNTFIVAATLASRAAIRGGMAVDDAFTLSDSYIQKCELLNFPDRITNLQYHMVLDFTQRVEQLRRGKPPTKLALDVANYIKHHLSEAITADAIAKELYVSRPYLSRKFKEDTGETLTDFILKEKTAEAKRLLRYSDKPLSAISVYLGFSSQSHFSRVFKKYASLGPGEYRQKYGR